MSEEIKGLLGAAFFGLVIGLIFMLGAQMGYTDGMRDILEYYEKMREKKTEEASLRACREPLRIFRQIQILQSCFRLR